jgi:hypothetical protein
VYDWLHQAAHILANDGQYQQAVLKQEYELLSLTLFLGCMRGKERKKEEIQVVF